MAIAKKCDRCGTLYEAYNMKNDEKRINGVMTLNIDRSQHHYSHGPFDLCPKCIGEFQNWFNNVDDVNGR